MEVSLAAQTQYVIITAESAAIGLFYTNDINAILSSVESDTTLP